MISLLFPLLLIANQAAPMPEPDAWMPVHELHLMIVDVDGNPLPGVTVSINPTGDWSGPGRRCPVRSSTGEDGRVVFKRLPGGDYDVKVEISGFLTMEYPNFPIRSGEVHDWRWIPSPELRVVMNIVAVS